LAQNSLDTASTTVVALPHSTLLATLAFTLDTDDIASESELGGLALVEVFECNMDAMDEILGFTWTRPGAATTSSKETASSTKELAEQILQERNLLDKLQCSA
jgi:hypothetical protein